MKTNIWVICFEAPGLISEHSQQLLYKAHNLLRENDALVSAICMGNYDYDVIRTLSKYGADEVIHSKEIGIDYRKISLGLADLIQNAGVKPKLILFPATEWGKCIAADLAIKIGAGLTAECIDIDAEKTNNEYQFTFTRAAINSSVLAQIQCINTTIGMCTCKKNVFAVTEPLPDKDVSIHEWKSESVYLSSLVPQILHSELIDCQERNVTLESSHIVFGIGRGIKDKKDLELIEKVAKKYNAAIAGTRAIVEEGLIEKRCQVGQSGISISPQIYVAIGISGATQHIVGIKNAKKIISINIDPNAPIFSYSDHCIIDDYKKIFQELISEQKGAENDEE
ncbi:MAG: electron transfer flavoprotein subunit alpha/FixB family protein [Eubacteriales bacterium]|nr:electron transfer flavoprotein subunit alpha/FixB family protein [Eubacteriales bacterium]